MFRHQLAPPELQANLEIDRPPHRNACHVGAPGKGRGKIKKDRRWHQRKPLTTI
jgi:hypothetical protein